MTSRSTSEYADVADMFDNLAAMDERSAEYRRQQEAIIARCLPLADHIARRFDNRGEAVDDLVQVARVGLIQAVNRFDPGFGSQFLAFAVPTIMGEVRRYFRDCGWSVKVPRRMKELGPQINRARDQLYQLLQRPPTATEIAAHLGISRDEVIQAEITASAYSTVSYDTPRREADDEDSRSVGDSFGVVDVDLDKVIDAEVVRPLINSLPRREQVIISLRFFDNMTQSEIACRLGISQMHVSRLLARSLATLRAHAVTPTAPTQHIDEAQRHPDLPERSDSRQLVAPQR